MKTFLLISHRKEYKMTIGAREILNAWKELLILIILNKKVELEPLSWKSLNERRPSTK